MNKREPRKQPDATRRKLVEAATNLMLKQGFNATTVDDICAEAGLTKGAFFHHFKDKDALALAAVNAWAEMGLSMYAQALQKPDRPLEEIHRIIEIMEEVTRKFDPCVCLVGMMTQEMSGESKAFRAACARALDRWTDMFRSRLQAAQEQLKPAVKFDPDQAAWFLNSIWQGSMLVAKSRQSPAMIRNNLKLARNYVDSLFANPAGLVSHAQNQTK
jgi:TetR/AcrR family transcriptional regulator, transcriptional repressor for nem operon